MISNYQKYKMIILIVNIKILEFSVMEPNIMDSLIEKPIKRMDLEYRFGLTDLNMLVCGKMIRQMDMGD